jgi:tRNA1(Val) A37 N6-methylase TrmN6
MTDRRMLQRQVWKFLEGQKKHTQDGSNIVSLMKSIGRGQKKVLAIDVGCGDGIISYDLLSLGRATEVLAIDISASAIATAAENLFDLGKEGRVQLMRISAKAFFKQKEYWDSFDRFVINPPFFKRASGRPNKTHLDQMARHETSLKLRDWAVGARRLLKTGGELYCVFPSERLSECLSTLSLNCVEPKEIWWLRQDLRRRRFFLRAVRNANPGVIVHIDHCLEKVLGMQAVGNR